MHYLPVLLFCLALKGTVLWAFGGPRNLWAFTKDCLSVCEDHWTWTTRAGEWFEDAEVEAIEKGEVILNHRYGVARLAIERLSERSRHILLQTQKWADYAASVPTEGKITPFVPEMATQAA